MKSLESSARQELVHLGVVPIHKRSEEFIERFRDILNANGVIATTRRTRGDDIDAACGQLVGRVHDRTTVRLGDKLIGVAVEA